MKLGTTLSHAVARTKIISNGVQQPCTSRPVRLESRRCAILDACGNRHRHVILRRGVSARRGFSLLEILIAAGILVGSLVVLSELAAIGRQHAEDARQLTAAQTLCETKLNEILAGVQPAEPAEDQPLDDAPGWRYTLAVEQLPQPGLLQLSVTRETKTAPAAPAASSLWSAGCAIPNSRPRRPRGRWRREQLSGVARPRRTPAMIVRHAVPPAAARTDCAGRASRSWNC